MSSLIVSQSICLGVMCGMTLRMLVSPETAQGPVFALFASALFGYWLFGNAIRREAAKGDK